MSGGRTRLGDHLASVDAARFSGRRRLLRWVDELLAGTGTTRVALVHGPGGIGKSALLREVGRRAMASGRVVWSLDARALEPVPGELERALAGAADQPGAVVLVDSFERAPALGALLRERVLPGLAADAVVVVAGREAASPDWFRDGWEHLCADVPLPPLPPDEARELLAACGVTDAAVVDPLVDWASGSPLALTLAAGGDRRNGPVDLAGVDLARMIVRRLAGDELGAVDADVLEVAAVARAVDARLLAAVLPGRPTRAAAETLRTSSVAELVGARVTLHDLVRTALRDDLRRRVPERYGDLRCRIADHLYLRATGGEPRLLSDLIELIDDQAVRWGIGGNAGDTCRVDAWRSDEVDDIVGAYNAHKVDPGWWDDLATLVDAAPEMGIVARDLDGGPLGLLRGDHRRPPARGGRDRPHRGAAAGRRPGPGRRAHDDLPRDVRAAGSGRRRRHRRAQPVGGAAVGAGQRRAVLHHGLGGGRERVVDRVHGRRRCGARAPARRRRPSAATSCAGCSTTARAACSARSAT